MSRSSLKALPLFVFSLLVLLVLVAPLQAAVRNELVFRVGCEGFQSRGGDIILNQDNTGTNRERFIIHATDGNGNTIYGPHEEWSYIGSFINIPAGLFFPWTSAPTANPLTVRVISPEGNGYREQWVYTATGSCGNLPTILIDFYDFESYAGNTSPSVPINADPPRPVGMELSLNDWSGYPGYLITTAGSLNIRSGDNAVYTIVGRVRNGTYLRVVGRNEDRSWWYVQVDDIVGWVNAEHVLIRGDLTDIPVVPVEGQVTHPTFVPYSRQTIYTLPIFRALPVCEVAGNLEYYVIGRDIGTDWYEIEAMCLDGRYLTGWIEADKGAIRNPGEVFIRVTD